MPVPGSAPSSDTFAATRSYFVLSRAKGRPAQAVCAYDRAVDPRAHTTLPEETLDSLVVVLDEIRLGRSRARAELVARTGLGRAIVINRALFRDTARFWCPRG